MIQDQDIKIKSLLPQCWQETFDKFEMLPGTCSVQAQLTYAKQS